MGVLIFILFIVFLVVLVIVKTKINNVKYRAKQTILNKAGIGDTQITSAADNMLEKGKMKKFLENHPRYTEESIKELIKNYASEVVNKNLTHSADQKVIEKLSNDNKITRYAEMKIVNANINGYNENAGLFMGKVTFSNGRDEYMMFLQFGLSGDDLILKRYQMQKGNMVGF